jgi:hypothetical protein
MFRCLSYSAKLRALADDLCLNALGGEMSAFTDDCLLFHSSPVTRQFCAVVRAGCTTILRGALPIGIVAVT